MMFKLLSVLYVIFVTSYAQVLGPIVEISSGSIQGEIVATHYDNVNVHSFQGIPFATPPLGELRFEVSTSGLYLFL